MNSTLNKTLGTPYRSPHQIDTLPNSCVKISRKRREVHASSIRKTADLLANLTGIADAKASPMKAKALILFLAPAGLLPLAAQAQIYYAISGNTAFVLHCAPSASGNIVIASNYDGYPVTSIGDYAFEDCYGLTNIVIPNNVMSIGDYAFYACIGLMSVVIPNSVTNIAWEAFFGCSALTNIVTGNGITSIGQAGFYNCYNLVNITVGTNVTNIGAGAFSDCTNLTSIIIPNSVTNIDEGAFQNCFRLTNVTFLGNPPTLGSYVFSGDNHVTVYYYYGTSGWRWFYYGLRTAMLGVVPFTYFTNNGTIIITSYTGTNDAVTIGPVINGFPVTDIDFNDFTVPQEYTNLTSITIPASDTGIGSDAFYGCINLTNVTFLGNAPALGYDVFDGDLATVYYYYGASGWGTIYGGLPVVELDVPFTYTTNNDVITITGYIGTNRTLTIGAPINGYPVTSVGEGVFIGSPLTSITITASVTNIDDKAFQDCAALTGITFLGNAPALGGTNVFANDSATAYFYYSTSGWGATWGGTAYGGLPTEVLDAPLAYTLNNGAVTITGYNGFGGAETFPDIIDVTIPDTIDGYPVTSIGYEAFNDDSSVPGKPTLSSIVIPNSVTSIGVFAVFNCSSLTSVTIPNRVTNIGDFAFAYCSSLTNITFLGNDSDLGEDVFFDDYSSSGLISGVVYYYYGTSGWSTTYGGLPTVMLGAPAPQIGGGGSVGVTPGNFSFTIAGVTNQTVVVEASTNLVDWQPVWSNTLSGASATFTDSQWTNYPARFYRAR